jgi:hypothetical protein
MVQSSATDELVPVRHHPTDPGATTVTDNVRTIGTPLASLDGTHRAVVVVGGGQAGLSMSWWLTHAGVDHLVLEAQTAGHEWHDRRWDSFCLVTPNPLRA